MDLCMGNLEFESGVNKSRTGVMNIKFHKLFEQL